MKNVFVEPERCVGCRDCELACAVAHSRSGDLRTAWTEVPVPTPRIHVDPGPVSGWALPSRCRHCDPAPCVGACPTGAMWRDAEQGVVLVAAGKCIACAMCAMVCPFDAVTFRAHDGVPGRVAATKCDGCIDRLRRDAIPACVEACHTGALVYGELNELIAARRLRASGMLLTTLNQGVSHESDESTRWH